MDKKKRKKKPHTFRTCTVQPNTYTFHHIVQWLTGVLVPDRPGCDSFLTLASCGALEQAL